MSDPVEQMMGGEGIGRGFSGYYPKTALNRIGFFISGLPFLALGALMLFDSAGAFRLDKFGGVFNLLVGIPCLVLGAGLCWNALRRERRRS